MLILNVHTSLQLHCLQYLIHEIVTGGSPKKAGGFFTASETEVPSAELRQLESFFNRIAFFPHVIDYRGTNSMHVTFNRAPSVLRLV
jgi:cytoplasmic FMR1 interacting protein